MSASMILTRHPLIYIQKRIYLRMYSEYADVSNILPNNFGPGGVPNEGNVCGLRGRRPVEGQGEPTNSWSLGLKL